MTITGEKQKQKSVQSAAPAIDNRPPLPRQHVALKLKKKQKESERCQEIEKNNFGLLKRLSYVMRTNRVDNSWSTPQPNFLNRVSMYDVKLPTFDDLYISEPKIAPQGPTIRKAKCLACTPQPAQEVKIPEGRVPWEPEKASISRFRSQSVPARKLEPAPEKTRAPKSAMPKVPVKMEVKRKIARKAEAKFREKEPQSIILSRGCLKLAVNFPSDTLVKLSDGHQEKILVQNLCHCKNVTGVTA